MGDLFKDKVVLVTGSGQGIGRAIALAFGEEGAKVVTNNRKPGATKYLNMTDDDYNRMTPERRAEYDELQKVLSGDAESTAKTIIDNGGEALPLYCDIKDSAAVNEMVATINEKWGGVDILINVAGGFGKGEGMASITEADFDKLNDIKPKGYFNVMRAVLPHMQAQKWGRIVNCSSKSSMGDIIRVTDYAAANAGVNGLSMGAACEYFHEGITVNIFSPWAQTRASYEHEFVPHEPKPGDKPMPKEGDEGFRPFPTAAETPTPDMLAPYILYLCTDYCAHVTGTYFTVAGGLVLMHQYPMKSASIFHSDRGEWTVEELRQTIRGTLLNGYENVIKFQ